MATKAKSALRKRVTRLKVPKRIRAGRIGAAARDLLRRPMESTKRGTERLTDKVLTMAFTVAAEALTQSLRDHRIERELSARDTLARCGRHARNVDSSCGGVTYLPVGC